MESIFLNFHKIIVPAFYAYLLYLFVRGLQTLPPKSVWMTGALRGLIVGIVWAAFAFLPWLLATDLYVGLVSYTLVGLPLSLPIHHLLAFPPQYFRGSDFIAFGVLMQAFMTILAATLVVATIYGYFTQADRNGIRTPLSILLGVVVLGLLTLVAFILVG